MNYPLLNVIAQALRPVLDEARPDLYNVRLEGTRRCLTAHATNGHVLARVVVLGDFSDIGIKSITGTSIEAASVLGDVTLSVRAEEPGQTPLRDRMDFLIPRSFRSCDGNGWFLGPALQSMAAVIAAFDTFVQFSGNDSAKHAMRVDSLPFLIEFNGPVESSLAWVTFAVMPGNVRR